METVRGLIRSSHTSQKIEKVLAVIEEETGYPPADRINIEIDKYNTLIAQAADDLVELQSLIAVRDMLRCGRNQMIRDRDAQNAVFAKPIQTPHWNPQYME